MLVIAKDKPPLVSDEKMAICLNCSPERCPSECGIGPFFPSPPPNPVTTQNHHMPFYFIIMLCVLGAIFVFICYMITLRRRRMNSSRNPQPSSQNMEQEFIDENHGPVLDHPIWYIHTIGLPQSIIGSIPVFRYKKKEALIEGTDCSVCLTEFEEDESLRLLPKCSHAFHVPCIDTWLTSHTNCPLCRAPVVSDLNAALTNNVEISSTNANSSPSEDNQVEDTSVGNDLENQELGEEENCETRYPAENLDGLSNEEGKVVGFLEKMPRSLDEKALRVFSDLAEHRVKVNDELQPARRSVSMDSSAVCVVHLAMSETNLGNGEGCSSSDAQLVEGKTENSDRDAKRGNRNSSLYEAMKSSSFSRSLQKVPIRMKRSFSTSGKCSISTSGRGQEL